MTNKFVNEAINEMFSLYNILEIKTLLKHKRKTA